MSDETRTLDERVARLEAELDTNGRPGSWAWNILRHETRIAELEKKPAADRDKKMLNALCTLGAVSGMDDRRFRVASAAGLAAWVMGKDGPAAIAAILDGALDE